MTKKVPKKILRIERNFFVNLIKNVFGRPRRRRQFFWTGGAPLPPTEIDRRAAADTMTSAHSSAARPRALRLSATRRYRSNYNGQTVLRVTDLVPEKYK